MNQTLKLIIDKIIWANLDIKDVVTAYEKEVKQRREYQQEIDDAQPTASKKKSRTPVEPVEIELQ